VAKTINEQRTDKFMELMKAINELNCQINAEYNHGGDYDSQAKRDDFKQFFDAKIKAVNDRYEEMKDLL